MAKRKAPLRKAAAVAEAAPVKDFWCAANDFPEVGSADPGRVSRAAGWLVKKWPTGSAVRVGYWERFPDPQLQRRVEEIAPEWTKYANLDFRFVGYDPNAQVRVAFSRQGHWSALGTDSQNRFAMPANSMNLALTPADDDDTFRAIILHEFGHALGLIHEHQNPEAGIPWDVPAVYAYFQRRYGWPPSQTFDNVLKRMQVPSGQMATTEFDPTSIMIYEVPAALTGGKYELRRQSRLSDHDKQLISRLYPGRWTEDETPDGGEEEPSRPRELVIDRAAVKAELGQPGDEHRFTFRVRKADGFVIETEGETNVTMGLFGPDDPRRPVAEDNDSGREWNARIVEFLEPGTYHVKVWHHDPSGTGRYQISVKTWQATG